MPATVTQTVLLDVLIALHCRHIKCDSLQFGYGMITKTDRRSFEDHTFGIVDYSAAYDG